MSRRLLVLAVAAVAIGHLDILVALGCGAAVVWFAQRRRRAVAA